MLQLHECAPLAGPDTWLGPTPAATRDALLAASRAAHRQANDLRLVARRLERQADQLAATAAR